MTLDLAFLAETQAEAKALAEEWARNEPNVESCLVLTVTGSAPHWAVRVDLTLREREQPSLWA